jgi:hypothetical protein
MQEKIAAGSFALLFARFGYYLTEIALLRFSPPDNEFPGISWIRGPEILFCCRRKHKTPTKFFCVGLP